MSCSLSLNTPIGIVTATEVDNKITKVSFGGIFRCDKTPLLIEAINQIQAYFEGKLKEFDLPYLQSGADFSKKVLDIIKTIPYGNTITYSNIAKEMGNLNYVRAVGGACRSNSLPLIIPCHRVIGKNGELVGYNGGIDIKKQLLDFEKFLLRGINEKH